MNKKEKKEKPVKTQYDKKDCLTQKELTAIEISMLSPGKASKYFAQLVLENLNNPLAHDNNN